MTCAVWFDIVLPTSQAYVYPKERTLPFSYWNVWSSSSKFCLLRSIFCCSVGHCPASSGINRTRDEQPVHINLSRFTSMLVVIPNSFSPLPYSAHCQNRATETTNVSTLLLAQFAHTTINALFKMTRARTWYSAAQSYYYHKYECSTTTKIFLVSDNVKFSFSLPAVSTPACSLPVMCKTFRAIPELSRLQILSYIYILRMSSLPLATREQQLIWSATFCTVFWFLQKEKRDKVGLPFVLHWL